MSGGRPKGTKQSPEAREKIRLGMIKRWQDPEYRERHLPRVRAQAREAGKLGTAAAAKANRIRPPRGTPEWNQYCKFARCLGIEAARALAIKSAETDRADL
jgi:hypothetical protein